jgi:hypothetical protein
MAIYVCRTPCQARMEGDVIKYFSDGQVVEVEDDFELPVHFDRLDIPEASIDFLTASEEELMASDWKFAAAKDAIKKAFNKTLQKAEKRDVVNQILDIRFRNIDLTPVPGA